MTRDKSETPKTKPFQDRLMSLLEWVAERDPIAAARLLSDYAGELANELGQEPCTDC